MEEYAKRTAESFSANAGEYYLNTVKLSRFVEPSIQKFLRMIPRNSRILDAGCGPGRDCKRFSELGYSVTGIDLAEKMIEFARKLVPSAEFSVMDMASLDFPDSSFNGAWVNSSLMFMRKDRAPSALKEISRVLRDGGCMFLRVKEGEGEGMTMDRRYGNAEMYCSYYQRDEIVRLVEEAGLEVLLTDRESIAYQYMTHPFIVLYCKKAARPEHI